MHEFSNKVAVITGAASGIGRALVEHALSEGMQVVAVDRDDKSLAQLNEQFDKQRCVTFSMDVCDTQAWQELAHIVLAHFGRVDLLFNNAGKLAAGPLWEINTALWRQIIDINLMGVVHGICTFVPLMLAQNTPAHIINTSSLAGLLPSPALGPYNVSKFGVMALSETLLYDLQQHALQKQAANIDVSVLCPGPVASAVATNAQASENGGQIIDWLRAGVAQGMTAEECARITFAGIRAKQFIILTHPVAADAVIEHTQRLMSGQALTYTQLQLI